MDQGLIVRVKRLEHSKGFPLPAYMSPDASGLDLIACIPEPIILKPGHRDIIPTGIKLMIPSGFEGQVRPRSGLAFKFGITVLNSPGTIDADYRGEVKIILFNSGEDDFEVNPGERIAQLVIAPVYRVKLEEVDDLQDSIRSENGFGSTGRS